MSVETCGSRADVGRCVYLLNEAFLDRFRKKNHEEDGCPAAEPFDACAAEEGASYGREEDD